MRKIFSKSMFKFLFAVGVFLIYANACNAAVSVDVSTNNSVIHKGSSANIHYVITGTVTSCWIDPNNGTGRTSISTTSPGDLSVTPSVTTTYTITCEYVRPITCPYYYPVCFIADTLITMADGTFKNIQDVKLGDVLKGEKTNNTVLGFHNPKLEDRKLYSFNGGRYFVTAEHPFKTTDGWKSIDPSKTAEENIGITVTPLHVGDTLLTENGKIVLKTIESKNDKVDTQLGEPRPSAPPFR